MYCSECGKQMPEGAKFCSACGAPAKTSVAATGTGSAVGSAPGGMPAAPGSAPPTPPPTGVTRGAAGGGPAGAAGAGGGPSTVTWVAVAAIAAVVIALAVAIPLIVVYGGESGDSTTTESVPATTTTVSATTTTAPPSSTTSGPTTSETTPSTTATTTPAPPGDSAGSWVEESIPGVPAGTFDIAVSDEAFAYVTYEGSEPKLSAYLFAEDRTLTIPVDSMVAGGPDLEGHLLVWREADYDADNEITEAHIFAYRLPDGPKVEVVSDTKLGYPQVAGSVVAWTLIDTWTDSPDEFALISIWGAAIDQAGQPAGAAGQLVPAALASIQGDSSWSYSLSPTHLSWETHESIDVYDPGTYVLDFDSMQPRIVSPLAFNDSIGGDTLVFREGGGTKIQMADLATGEITDLDTKGDYPSAGPTYAAYFRAKSGGDWQVVARGFTGAYEQVLVDSTGDPPWFLPAIATSAHRIVFVVGDTVRAFVWRAG